MCFGSIISISAGVNLSFFNYRMFTANKETWATPLHLASQRGMERIVQLLSERMTEDEVNLKERVNGNTPLQWAPQNGHSQIVRQLVKSGARVDEVDFNGITPFLKACDQERSRSSVI